MIDELIERLHMYGADFERNNVPEKDPELRAQLAHRFDRALDAVLAWRFEQHCKFWIDEKNHRMRQIADAPASYFERPNLHKDFVQKLKDLPW